VKAQRLQARGQAQHHHAQIAREGEQHLAHVFGLQRGVVELLRTARLALHAHELGGLDGQLRKVGAEGFGDGLFGFGEVVAGIDQVARGLHGLGAANAAQNGGHGVSVGQDVLAGVEQLGGQQGFGKSARARQRMGLLRQAVGGSGDDRQDRFGGGVRIGDGLAFHGVT